MSMIRSAPPAFSGPGGANLAAKRTARPACIRSIRPSMALPPVGHRWRRSANVLPTSASGGSPSRAAVAWLTSSSRPSRSDTDTAIGALAMNWASRALVRSWSRRTRRMSVTSKQIMPLRTACVSSPAASVWIGKKVN